jgi:hypothetical protein
MARSKIIRAHIKPARVGAGKPVGPNAATRKALREARSRKTIESFETVGAWAKAMRST